LPLGRDHFLLRHRHCIQEGRASLRFGTSFLSIGGQLPYGSLGAGPITASNAENPSKAVAIVSYDEKPGIQAIATIAPDLPPKPGVHPTFARDYE
jgi:hypothetical protein